MKKTIVLITLFMLMYLKLLDFFTCMPRFRSTNPKIWLFNQQLYIYHLLYTWHYARHCRHNPDPQGTYSNCNLFYN